MRTAVSSLLGQLLQTEMSIFLGFPNQKKIINETVIMKGILDPVFNDGIVHVKLMLTTMAKRIMRNRISAT